MKTTVHFFALSLFAGVAAGADFSIPWSTIDGGGGLSASVDGRFLLNGTSGQPDAGLAIGGNFSLEGGYWNSVQCASGLTITRYVEDLVAERPTIISVSWPAADLGDCVLESTTELHTNPSLIVWTPVAFRRVGGFNFHTTTPAGTARFFRLRPHSP
jgi:hypothetical protein